MKNWKTSAEAILTTGPVVPVIVVNKLEHAVPMAKALVAGGVRVFFDAEPGFPQPVHLRRADVWALPVFGVWRQRAPLPDLRHSAGAVPVLSAFVLDRTRKRRVLYARAAFVVIISDPMRRVVPLRCQALQIDGFVIDFA